MKTLKQVLCRERLRQVPEQFSWVDQALVQRHFIDRCDARALALYLFLVTVADAQGASYYSDSTVAGMLGFCSTELRSARAELVAARLIAHSSPFYQVLSLEPAVSAAEEPAPRVGEERSIGEILRSMMEAP